MFANKLKMLMVSKNVMFIKCTVLYNYYTFSYISKTTIKIEEIKHLLRLIRDWALALETNQREYEFAEANKKNLAFSVVV